MTPPGERARNIGQGMSLVRHALDLLARIDGSLLQIARQTQSRADNALSEGANHGAATVGQGGISNNGWNGPHLLDANPERRGLQVQNIGTSVITLGLGLNSPTPGSGIVLAAGTSWDGRVSGMVWKGSVTPVSSAAGGLVAFVEV